MSSVRQLPKIHPAPLTGEVAPTRDSGRGPATRCVPQISCGADSLSTHAEARAAIFEFIEGYASPLEFERLHAAGPVDGAQPVDAFPAPTSLLEPGSPAPTRVVTGVLLETHGGNDGLQAHDSPSASHAG